MNTRPTCTQSNSIPTDSSSVVDAISVIDLHKSFADLEVLKGVNLSASKGEVVAIIGGSGSGKSTLLRCINMLETPTAGRIFINGEEYKMKTTANGLIPANKHQVRQLRSSLSMVFQTFNLWQHMTLLQNLIEVPMLVHGESKAQATEHAEKLLERVGLIDKRDTYPAFLSGGQQQRAAIARAVAVSPQVMLFDEPTSALDPELVGEVLKVIADLADEGRTMLLVTHEMNFAREVANKVVFLHQGVVEEQGSPEKLFSNPESARLKQFISSVQ